VQEKKLALRKHQTLFDDLTLARSKEALARRELARLKGHPRSDDTSDSDADRDKRPESSGGYGESRMALKISTMFSLRDGLWFAERGN